MLPQHRTSGITTKKHKCTHTHIYIYIKDKFMPWGDILHRNIASYSRDKLWPIILLHKDIHKLLNLLNIYGYTKNLRSAGSAEFWPSVPTLPWAQRWRRLGAGAGHCWASTLWWLREACRRAPPSPAGASWGNPPVGTGPESLRCKQRRQATCRRTNSLGDAPRDLAAMFTG